MKKNTMHFLLATMLLAIGGCQSSGKSTGSTVVIVDGAQPDAAPLMMDAAIDEPVDAAIEVQDVNTPNVNTPDVNTVDPPPMNGDSDGDGYTDEQEEHAGTDPNDPNSVIYRGGWPYNMNKDEIEDPGWDVPPEDGGRMPRWRTIDQYGDTFDLYDLAGHGRKIVLDVGTWFCTPCKAMAQYFATGDASVMDDFAWWNPDYNRVLDLINNEEVFWVTVLFSGSVPVSQEDVTRWHDTFPNHHILVLGDQDLQLREYLSVVAMPHIDVLDENMNFLVYEVRGPTRGMRFLADSE